MKRVKLGKISASPLEYGLKCSRPGIDVDTGDEDDEEQINFYTGWDNVVPITQFGEMLVTSGTNSGDRVYYVPLDQDFPNIFEFRNFNDDTNPRFEHDLRRTTSSTIKTTRHMVCPGIESGGAHFIEAFRCFDSLTSPTYMGIIDYQLQYVIYGASQTGPVV